MDCHCGIKRPRLLFGVVLGFAARRFEVEEDPVAEQIDEILPQSQCGQCGYPAAVPTPRRSPTAR
ncbi:electron transport complex protein RnfB [Serratia rubidaea]|uniref:Electron transport complex protein RnfB n=1 Tax=Serratia rubidaea TaxID=61652 RepID=A0A4V6JH47_SERRU|nr:electron transport complex protein RnfB [Serratia rubidaea]